MGSFRRPAGISVRLGFCGLLRFPRQPCTGQNGRVATLSPLWPAASPVPSPAASFFGTGQQPPFRSLPAAPSPDQADEAQRKPRLEKRAPGGNPFLLVQERLQREVVPAAAAGDALGRFVVIPSGSTRKGSSSSTLGVLVGGVGAPLPDAADRRVGGGRRGSRPSGSCRSATVRRGPTRRACRRRRRSSGVAPGVAAAVCRCLRHGLLSHSASVGRRGAAEGGAYASAS